MDIFLSEARAALPRRRESAMRNAARIADLPALFGPMNNVVSSKLTLKERIDLNFSMRRLAIFIVPQLSLSQRDETTGPIPEIRPYSFASA
jgi:hypothetical protein